MLKKCKYKTTHQSEIKNTAKNTDKKAPTPNFRLKKRVTCFR